MKSGKKPLTKNLVYSPYNLADEDDLEGSPLDPKNAVQPVRKARDRNEQRSPKSRK